MHKITLFCLIISSAIHATNLDHSTADSINSELNLKEIIISASRLEDRKLLIPSQVAQLSNQQITFNNPQSSALLLQNSGTISMQMSQQGGGSPSIRGFEASRILLVVDNVRMNNLIFRAGHLQNIISVSPSALDKIDVIYGPSSVFFGSDALGGVIHLQTLKPQLNLTHNRRIVTHADASIRYASVNNEISSNFSINIANRKWASFTAASYSSFGDLTAGKQKNPFIKDDEYIKRDFLVQRINQKDSIYNNPNRYKQIGSAYQQYDLLQKILYKPNSETEHLFNIQVSNTSNIPRYDRLTDLKDNKPKFAEWYYGPQTRALGCYTFNQYNRLGADRIRLITAYQQFRESRHSRNLNNVDKQNQYEKVDAINLSADWLKEGVNTLHFGIDGALNFVQSRAFNLNIDNEQRSKAHTRYPTGSKMHNIDLFASHKYTFFNNKLSLSDGIRIGYTYSYLDFTKTEISDFQGKYSRHNPTISANIGLNYLSDKKFRTSILFSSGYRVPNIDDMGKVFDSQPGRVYTPNPNLKAEKNIQTEINFTKYNNNGFEWETAIFATLFFDALAVKKASLAGKDSIDYQGTLSEVYAMSNSDRALLVGISSILKYSFNKQIMAKGSINYTHGRYITNHQTNKYSPFDHVAPLFGRIAILFNTPNQRFQTEIFSLFNGKKYLCDYNLTGEDNIRYATVKGEAGNGLPAWFTLNIKGSYRFKQGITLQAGIENILDTEYRSFASGINGAGRNIYATLRYRFE